MESIFMTAKTPKLPQRDAVAKITAERNKLKHQPSSPELREIFRKENYKGEKPQKKIARSPKQDSDIEL